MIHHVMRRVIRPSLHDPGPGPVGELGVLFDQSPIAMVLRGRELRARRTNAALRRLAGLPDEALLGRRPAETDLGVDTALMERILVRQVLGRGVPVIDVHLELTVAGERRVLPG
jgi:PAS domain-containing protein